MAGSRRSLRTAAVLEGRRIRLTGEVTSTMATQATRTAKEGRPRVPGRALPLNSQRLTDAVMCRIARELGVTGLASAEDMRQIVEGKLGELGHPPENVRVELAEMEQGVVVVLQEREDDHVSAEEKIGEDVDGDGAAVVAPGTDRAVELEATSL